VSGIYVISKSRVPTLVKAAKAGIETGLPFVVLVEPGEYREYRDALKKAGLLAHMDLVKHKRDNIGIVKARRHSVELSARRGDDVMLMVDDDLKLPWNAGKLVHFLRMRKKAPACAVWFPIYQHFARINPNTGAQRNNGGMGRRAFSVRPQQLLDIGAFTLPYQIGSDTDMLMRLFRDGYYPWYIHSDVKATSLLNRYGPGGISTIPGTIPEKEQRTHELLTKEFGEGLFTYTAKGNIRINWKRVYQKYTDLDYPELRRKNVR